jgi:hypothetical protein
MYSYDTHTVLVRAGQALDLDLKDGLTHTGNVNCALVRGTECCVGVVLWEYMVRNL